MEFETRIIELEDTISHLHMGILSADSLSLAEDLAGDLEELEIELSLLQEKQHILNF